MNNRITVFSLVAFAALASGCGERSPEERADIEQKKKESKLKIYAKGYVEDKLKDPNSAKFGTIFYSRKGGSDVICGEVNSRNSFGGYTGYQGFISGGTFESTYIEESTENFASVWKEFCR